MFINELGLFSVTPVPSGFPVLGVVLIVFLLGHARIGKPLRMSPLPSHSWVLSHVSPCSHTCFHCTFPITAIVTPASTVPPCITAAPLNWTRQLPPPAICVLCQVGANPNKSIPYLQGRNRDTDVQNRHVDTAGKERVGKTERLALTYRQYLV